MLLYKQDGRTAKTSEQSKIIQSGERSTTPASFYIAACLLVCLRGFITSSFRARLYRGRVPRLTSDNIKVLPQTRQSGETMTSVSADHIILTPIQPVGCGRPQWGSNPGPPHQESHSLPNKLVLGKPEVCAFKNIAQWLESGLRSSVMVRLRYAYHPISSRLRWV